MNNNIFQQQATQNVSNLIETLKKWRSILWETAYNNSTAYLISI